MSSLLSQLNKLKSNAEAKLPYKSTASLLFDFRFANKIDVESVYEIGYEGLIELSKVHQHYTQYFNTLFSSTSKYFNRDTATLDVIKVIDEEIKSLLRYLSIDFNNKNAHKVIEYLIKVYKINAFLPNDLFLSFICYCDTNVFLKLIQNVNFDSNPKWAFVKDFATKGERIPKESVAKVIAGDFDLFKEVLEYEMNYNKIDNDCFNIDYAKFVFEVIECIISKDTLKNIGNYMSVIVKWISFMNNHLKIDEESTTWLSHSGDRIFIICTVVHDLVIKVNISNDYLKAIANDITQAICSVDDEIHKENVAHLLIGSLTSISKRFTSNSLFNQNSLKALNKINFEENLSNDFKDIEYFLYQILSSSSADETLISFTKNLLLHFLENNVEVMKSLMLLLNASKNESNSLIWKSLSTMVEHEFNLAYIDLYSKKQLTKIINMSYGDSYVDLIGSNVPKVLNALKAIDKKELKEPFTSAIASKFLANSEEVVLNSIFAMKHFNIKFFSSEVSEFYFGIVDSMDYTEDFMDKLEKILKPIEEDNLKLSFYLNIFYSKGQSSKKEIKSSVKFLECLYDIAVNFSNVDKVKKINVKATAQGISAAMKTKEDISKIVEKILLSDEFLKFDEVLYTEVGNEYVKYVNEADNDRKLLLAESLAHVAMKKANKSLMQKILYEAFKGIEERQIFLSRVLLKMTSKEEKEISFVLPLIVEDITKQQKIEFSLGLSLIVNISYLSQEDFNSVFKCKLIYHNISKLYQKSHKNIVDAKEAASTFSNFIKEISDNIIELKVNKNFIRRIIESNTFKETEELYTMIVDSFLFSEMPNLKETQAILDYFTLGKTNSEKRKYAKENLEAISQYVKQKSEFSVKLIKNYFELYPKTKVSDIIKVISEEVCESKLIDVLFDYESPITATYENASSVSKILTFGIQNHISPYMIQINLTEKNIEEFLEKSNRNLVAYFLKLITITCSSFSEKVFHCILSIVRDNITIDECYAIHSIANSNKVALDEKILKNAQESIIKMVQQILTNEDDNDYDKKIELLLFSSNSLSANFGAENQVLLELSSDNSILRLIFNAIIDFLAKVNVSISKGMKKIVKMKKYFKIIINNIEDLNDEAIVKMFNSDIVVNNEKYFAFALYKTFRKFSEEKTSVLSSFALNKEFSLLKWIKICEEIAVMKSQPISVELIGNLFSHLNKVKVDLSNEKLIANELINLVALVYEMDIDLTEKIFLLIKKKHLIFDLIKALYTESNDNIKSVKNYLLLKVSQSVKRDNDNKSMYEFILEKVITKEKRCENLIYIYTTLDIIAIKDDEGIFKKSYDKITANLPTKSNDDNHQKLFFTISQYIFTVLSLNPTKYLKIFNNFMNKYIAKLEEINLTSPKKLVIKTLNQLASNSLCKFLSPFLAKLIPLIILIENQKLKDILTSISKNNHFDSSFGAIEKVEKVNENYLHFLSAIISNCDSLTIADSYLRIVRFYCSILRKNQECADKICSTFQSFILKINEKQLSQIFNDLMQVIQKVDDNRNYIVENIIVVFQLFNQFGLVIKDIFTKYFGRYKGILIQLVHTYIILALTPEKSKKSPLKLKQKTQRDESEESQNKILVLANTIIDNISIIYKFSKGEIISDTTEEIFDCMIEQYKINTIEINNTIAMNFYSKHFIVAIIKILSSLKNEDLFRQFNDDLLNLLREESDATKYFTLMTVEMLMNDSGVKDRYLTLVSEIVPYVADMIEENNDVIRKIAISILDNIEKTTGESYKTYLE